MWYEIFRPMTAPKIESDGNLNTCEMGCVEVYSSIEVH